MTNNIMLETYSSCAYAIVAFLSGCFVAATSDIFAEASGYQYLMIAGLVVSFVCVSGVLAYACWYKALNRFVFHVLVPSSTLFLWVIMLYETLAKGPWGVIAFIFCSYFHGALAWRDRAVALTMFSAFGLCATSLMTLSTTGSISLIDRFTLSLWTIFVLGVVFSCVMARLRPVRTL